MKQYTAACLPVMDGVTKHHPSGDTPSRATENYPQFVERHKSFVYQEARWADPATKTTLEIPIEPRANSRAICSGCGQAAPGYDRLAERRFEFVPLWRIAVYFVYAMRRVDCPRCGVRVEQVPWCDGKHR